MLRLKLLNGILPMYSHVTRVAAILWANTYQMTESITFSAGYNDPMFACKSIKETKSATMNIFRFFCFFLKSFVKVESSYVFTINLFTIAVNCTEK